MPQTFDKTAKVKMERQTNAIIHKGKDTYSVIEDTGTLLPAIAGSGGNYYFGDNAVGARPLVVVGTPFQIMDLFAREAAKGAKIVNSISELPEIYIGITPYVPGKRFIAHYPFSEFSQQIVSGLIEVGVRTSELVDFLTNLGTFATNSYDLYKLKKGNKGFDDQVFYVKFTYLPGDESILIGKDSVSFEEIDKNFMDNLRKAVKS